MTSAGVVGLYTYIHKKDGKQIITEIKQEKRIRREQDDFTDHFLISTAWIFHI